MLSRRATITLLGFAGSWCSLASVIVCGALGACGGALAPTSGAPDASSGPSPYAAECANAPVPPLTIECTGLYSNVAAEGARARRSAVRAGRRPSGPTAPRSSAGSTCRRERRSTPPTRTTGSSPSAPRCGRSSRGTASASRRGCGRRCRPPTGFARRTRGTPTTRGHALVGRRHAVGTAASTTSRRATSATSATAGGPTTSSASSRSPWASRARRASRSRSW